MPQLTVICHEDGYPNDILIYTVDADPNNEAAVQAAIQHERNADLGEDVANPVQILFAFAGDLTPVADWRE